ncbi:MAG: glycosyltransferase [Methanomicrobiales archaeon]|nr:glycosyltransferase [Methanomicrobiales archaeon]
MPEVGTGKVIPAGSPLPDRTVQGLISIILATYDERENIRKSIETIFSIIPAPVEVIVVDDDSPDGTWKVVEEMADPRVVLVRRTRTRGLASAIVRGIVESRGSIVCWWDADMPKCVERVPDMLSALETADVVVGSRYAEGGSDERDPVRVLTSKLLNGMATLVLGYGIRDYDSGVVVLRRRVFDYASTPAAGRDCGWWRFPIPSPSATGASPSPARASSGSFGWAFPTAWQSGRHVSSRETDRRLPASGRDPGPRGSASGLREDAAPVFAGAFPPGNRYPYISPDPTLTLCPVRRGAGRPLRRRKASDFSDFRSRESIPRRSGPASSS